MYKVKDKLDGVLIEIDVTLNSPLLYSSSQEDSLNYYIDINTKCYSFQ
jgi:hypothetical protein